MKRFTNLAEENRGMLEERKEKKERKKGKGEGIN
jgi:hypothetical protein